MLRVCKNCNKEFEVELLPNGRYSRRQYCSRECEINYNRKNKKKNKCKYCGKDINVYYADGSYAKTLEYCSDKCREAALKEKYGYSICKKCGKKFERIRLPHGGYDERLYCPECTEKFNIRICINCGKEYNIKEVNGSKYCKECKEKLEHSDNYKICVDCGKEFKIPLSSTNSGRKSNTIYCPNCEALRYEKAHYGNIINLGLSLDNDIIQVMTFGKPRYNKNYQWELLRLCTKSNYIVIGGAEKLFKYFIKNYNPESIISYCDNSKFRGDVYLNLGFNEQWATNPSKIWSKDDKYVTDNLLRQRGFDQLIGSKLSPPEIYGKGTDNEKLMIAHKWLPVYDCGQQIFKWRKIE